MEQRVKEFNEAMGKLLKKYSLGLSAEAFIHDGKILAKPVLVEAVDTDKKGV